MKVIVLTCFACVAHGGVGPNANVNVWESLASLLVSPNSAHAFNVPGAPLPARSAVGRAAAPQMAQSQAWKQGAAAALAIAAAMGGQVQDAHAGPFTQSEINSLTYEQVKGTGLANTCPRVEAPQAGASISVAGGKYTMNDFCMEPTVFQVIDEVLTRDGPIKKTVDTKVTTRQTYVLTGIDGDLGTVDGKLAFQEKDGIDYAATTVQLPGGARVPFLFTVKNLVAKSDGPTSSIEVGNTFAGRFKVPSYRTGLFLDPKGRGTTTGYDQAVALPAMQAGGDEAMFKENNKVFEVLDGSVELKVTMVNKEFGEIGGEFVQKQPSDTDLGSKEPVDLVLKGNWFATINKA